MFSKSTHHLLVGTTLFVVVLLSQSSLNAQTRSWGRNHAGQLGLGDFNSQTTPVTIANSDGITGISAGEAFTLFLKADGTVMATGDNSNGQLGDGTQSIRSAPVPVTNLTNVTAISTGQLHSLALLADGTLMAWGRNAEGQLGNGGGGLGQFSTMAIPVINLTNVTAISTGGLNSLALKSDGTVWAWGSNSDAQLGNGTAPNSNAHGTPVQVGTSVAGFTNIIAISTGVVHNVALKSDGTVWVWGSNVFGAGGNGSTSGSQTVPMQVASLTGVSQIAAGWFHNYAVKSNGTVFAWGYNVRGNMGDGTVTTAGCQCIPTPTQTSITNVVSLKVSNQHTLARKTDGSLWAWGWNFYGQLGNGTTLTTGCQCLASPIQVTAAGGGNSIIAAGYFHSFAAIPVVTLQPGTNLTTAGENFELHFSSIVVPTTITVTSIDPTSTGLTVPAGYTILSNAAAYNITSSPAITGTIVPCVRVLSVFDPTQFAALRILHGEGGTFVDRTVLPNNFQFREVEGSVTSLSPFVIAQVGPTAANVSVSGRVLSAFGNGVSGARVILTDQNGVSRAATTNSFGYFRFDDVQSGETYVFTPIHRRYQFVPRAVTIVGEVTDLIFTSEN